MRARKCIISIPTPALPGSGFMGIISARYIKAPLRFGNKGSIFILIYENILFIKFFYIMTFLMLQKQKKAVIYNINENVVPLYFKK